MYACIFYVDESARREFTTRNSSYCYFSNLRLIVQPVPRRCLCYAQLSRHFQHLCRAQCQQTIIRDSENLSKVLKTCQDFSFRSRHRHPHKKIQRSGIELRIEANDLWVQSLVEMRNLMKLWRYSQAHVDTARGIQFKILKMHRRISQNLIPYIRYRQNIQS